MNRRIMEDIKLENGRIHKIIKNDHNFNIDDDADDLKDKPSSNQEVHMSEPEPKIQDKVDEYIKYRYSKKTLSSTPQIKKPKKPVGRSIFFFFIIIIVIVGTYWASIYFEKATILIKAKEQLSTLTNKQFVASKAKDSDLGFEIMIMSGDQTKTMTLTETDNISVKASGQVTLLNEFSKTNQNLLVGTFLSDNNGKTYRLNNNVKIPGFTLDKENKIIPGSVDVTITAFLPGEAYNGTPKDFQIVGFKGTAKYTKIYAKAKSIVSGGRTGLVYVLSEDQKAKMDGRSDSLILEDLQKKLSAEVPEGYIYYPGAISYNYNLGENNYFEKPIADVHIAYNLSVVLLKKDELSKVIIKNLLPKISSGEFEEIKITDLSKLNFSFVNNNQFINKELESVIFNLTGPVDLLWNPNINEIKNKIAGTPKNNITDFFNSMSGIAKAELKMLPPWKSNLPTDIHRINVIIR